MKKAPLKILSNDCGKVNHNCVRGTKLKVCLFKLRLLDYNQKATILNQ